jgi:hypothetical protein
VGVEDLAAEEREMVDSLINSVVEVEVIILLRHLLDSLA